MSEPRELPDVLTPCTPTQLARELAWAWIARFDSPPTTKALCILLAQWALETGRGRYCHAWNIGNAKSTRRDGRSWTYYRCNEVIGGKVVWFNPPDPGCCFRAYETLREGAVDYLDTIARRYKAAWPAVLNGDPAGFAHELKRLNYYTANENAYRNSVVSLFCEFLPTITHEMIDAAARDDVALDAEARERLLGLLAVSLAEQTRDLDAGPVTEPSA